MKKLMKNATLVLALAKIRLTRKLADAPSFWEAFFVDTAVFGIQALVFWVIYLNADEPNGWERWKSVFFIGTFTFIDALYMTLYFFGVLRIPEVIRTGELDLYASKPADPLLAIAFGRMDPGSALIILPASGLIGASIANLGIRITLGAALAWLAAVILMLVLMFALMVLIRIPSFRFKRAESFQSVENVLVSFSFRVPGYAYAGASRIIFRVLLPYGLIAAFPTEAFFEGGAVWLEAVPVVVVFTILTRLAWKRALAGYESTGT
jgi:ABC-2 type transport system permease protein